MRHDRRSSAAEGDVMADKLVVVGQGYVGLPLAMRAVDAGFDVVGFDVDATKVK
jgi:UDP-N-acetyl-D-glucosamine dehydrogenase